MKASDRLHALYALGPRRLAAVTRWGAGWDLEPTDVVVNRNICPCRELNPSQLAPFHLLMIYLPRVVSDKSAFVDELDSARNSICGCSELFAVRFGLHF
jgi:hypothetical protein